jgi:hypothetical protein
MTIEKKIAKCGWKEFADDPKSTSFKAYDKIIESREIFFIEIKD